VSDTICSAFWKHTNIRPGNKIYPCCRFKTSIGEFDGNLNQVLNSSAYQQLRTASLAGEKISGCAKCYHEEKHGRESTRQKFNREYTADTVELKFLEIGFDNVCNLTCDGCGPEFSSAWANKLNKISVKPTVVQSPINHVPETVTKVLFLGGEPLMTNSHVKFLQRVPDINQVSLVYNTNGTFLLTDGLICLLRQFKNVEFIVSIDGYGHTNTRVRSGSNWEDIIKFINQLVELNFKFTIHTTLHQNNWQDIDQLSNWINHNGWPWTVNILTYPQHLDVAELPMDQKNQLIDKLVQHNLPDSVYIIKHLL
jgi:sulfatase maturation enzyme AslB (radical SAM superfamily)